MNIQRSKVSIKILLFITGATFIFSCRSTKYVPEDQYLLDKNKLKFEKKAIDGDELKTYLRQKPNKKILGFKFNLWLYNRSKINKDNGFNRWLRKIGEEPSVLDTFRIEKSRQQLSSYSKNKGYFKSIVTDTIQIKNRKATVTYKLDLGDPYRIRNIHYQLEDTSITSMVLQDTVNSLVRRGAIYDVKILQDERDRIERMLKNRGYYSFTKEYVYFEVDSALGDNRLDVYLGIKSYINRISSYQTRTEPHRKYRINRVYVYSNYDSRKAISDREGYLSSLDTVIYNGVYYLGESARLPVRPEVINRSSYILSGDIYSLENVDETYNHLSSLRVFKLINIQFRDYNIPVPDAQNEYILDCYIQLSTFQKQSYTFEIEGTNSSGNLGVAGNFIYQHKNLFRGAENFEIKFKGALEALSDTLQDRYKLRYIQEYGVEAGLKLPGFLFPFFDKEQFIKKYDPKTRISLAYNYQRRPDYARTIARGSFGYQWKGNSFATHLVNPFELNFVNISIQDSGFFNDIQGTFLEYSFRDVLISELLYSFVYNNQNIKRRRDFTFFRVNASTSGNLLMGYSKLLKKEKIDDSFEILNTAFAQYVKADFDFSYHQVLNDDDEIVYRIFSGIGYPYGNSRALPFEKKYFSGGANSLRAWNVRTIGPGSESSVIDSRFPNQSGDIKLEANLEYRFKLFWVLEGALFLDAGNVWEIYRDDDRPLAGFRWDRFYREIAVGTGFGIRFDFSFFIFRTDFGMKLHDPANNWTIGDRRPQDNFRLFAFQLGIGYPF